jgi:hypothetical protein
MTACSLLQPADLCWADFTERRVNKEAICAKIFVLAVTASVTGTLVN